MRPHNGMNQPTLASVRPVGSHAAMCVWTNAHHALCIDASVCCIQYEPTRHCRPRGGATVVVNREPCLTTREPRRIEGSCCSGSKTRARVDTRATIWVRHRRATRDRRHRSARELWKTSLYDVLGGQHDVDTKILPANAAHRGPAPLHEQHNRARGREVVGLKTSRT